MIGDDIDKGDEDSPSEDINRNIRDIPSTPKSNFVLDENCENNDKQQTIAETDSSLSNKISAG